MDIPQQGDPVPPISDLSLYVAALSAAYLLPGPDMAMVMSTSIGRGTRSGLLASIGLAASRGVHVVSSGLGLSAVFAAYPILFISVRWLGAMYLIWLAWKVVSASQIAGEESSVANNPGHLAIRQGFLTNLLNPKAFMFCALFLPQFIAPSQGSVFGQYALLGAILVIVGFLFDMIYALAANVIAERLGRDQTAGKIAKTLFAGVFALTATRLVIG